MSAIGLHPDFILGHVLQIELIKMREITVPAPDRKMPATYRQVMGTSHVAVSAGRGFKKSPEIVTADLCECSWHGDIFNTRDKDPGRATVVTCYFSFVGNCFNYLVCNLPAMVTISAEFCENELVAHGRYWICPGSLICCMRIPPSSWASIRSGVSYN